MPRRVGRPGLVGMAARTAVVAGTAGAVSHKQQQKYAKKDAEAAAQQQQAQAAAAPPAPVPAAGGGADMISQLEKLADLKANGLLTDAEYTAAKAKLLGYGLSPGLAAELRLAQLS